VRKRDASKIPKLAPIKKKVAPIPKYIAFTDSGSILIVDECQALAR
jgi:hypothetical protein